MQCLTNETAWQGDRPQRFEYYLSRRRVLPALLRQVYNRLAIRSPSGEAHFVLVLPELVPDHALYV
jgi:hypothetical protein